MASSHASASREGGGEALTEGVQARLLSSEITSFGLPTLWSEGEVSTVRCANASGASNPRSLRTGACKQTLCTETGRSQGWPIVNPAVGPVGEGQEADRPTCTSLGSRTKA